MFCDLVGSTPLSSRLDPEDLRGIIGAYHRCVAEIVEGFGGFVARFMGDGALVYFGYPQAHEDNAERATRCGLVLVDRVARLGHAEELHARVGIATGLVVVGGEVVEHDVAGDTPNLAARLQTLAEPDGVVIAASTRRLTGDLFEYRDLGEIELKGIGRPVSAWQALRPSAVASRFEALRGSALNPLVGRDEEMELLLRRWARAKAGDGQVVLVSGEPGIGKSRLTAELKAPLGLFAIVKQIVDAGRQFRSLAEPCADTATSTGRLMITVPGGLAGDRQGEGGPVTTALRFMRSMASATFGANSCNSATSCARLR